MAGLGFTIVMLGDYAGFKFSKITFSKNLSEIVK